MELVPVHITTLRNRKKYAIIVRKPCSICRGSLCQMPSMFDGIDSEVLGMGMTGEMGWRVLLCTSSRVVLCACRVLPIYDTHAVITMGFAAHVHFLLLLPHRFARRRTAPSFSFCLRRHRQWQLDACHIPPSRRHRCIEVLFVLVMAPTSAHGRIVVE